MKKKKRKKNEMTGYPLRNKVRPPTSLSPKIPASRRLTLNYFFFKCRQNNLKKFKLERHGFNQDKNQEADKKKD